MQMPYYVQSFDPSGRGCGQEPGIAMTLSRIGVRSLRGGGYIPEVCATDLTGHDAGVPV